VFILDASAYVGATFIITMSFLFLILQNNIDIRVVFFDDFDVQVTVHRDKFL